MPQHSDHPARTLTQLKQTCKGEIAISLAFWPSRFQHGFLANKFLSSFFPHDLSKCSYFKKPHKKAVSGKKVTQNSGFRRPNRLPLLRQRNHAAVLTLVGVCTEMSWTRHFVYDTQICVSSCLPWNPAPDEKTANFVGFFANDDPFIFTFCPCIPMDTLTLSKLSTPKNCNFLLLFRRKSV